MSLRVRVKAAQTGQRWTFSFTEERFKRTTVLQLKAKISEREEIPEDRLRLTFVGQQLEDQRLLSDYGVKRGDTVYVDLLRMDGTSVTQSDLPHILERAEEVRDTTEMDVKFFVETMRGETLTFIVTRPQFKSTTVLQLKTKIREREETPESQQRLIFADRELQNQRLLSDCGVKHESTVHMVQRLTSDREGGNQTSQFPVQAKSAAEATDTRQKSVQFRVHSPRGEERIIDLWGTEEQLKNITVLQLKEKIESVFGISGYDINLVFGTECLEEDALLSAYGIRSMSTIHVVLRLAGGGYGLEYSKT